MFTALHQVLRGIADVGFGWAGWYKARAEYFGPGPTMPATPPEVEIAVHYGLTQPSRAPAGFTGYLGEVTLLSVTQSGGNYGAGASTGYWVRPDSGELFRRTPLGQEPWEVKFTPSQGLRSTVNFNFTGDAIDVWLPLTAVRSWNYTSKNIPFNRTEFPLIEIRNGASENIVASQVLELSFVNTITGV